MYLLIEQDGTVTEFEELPSYVSWDCWPIVIKVEIYTDSSHDTFRLTKDGFKLLPHP